MCDITELLSVGSLCGAGVRQSGGCWKAVGGSRKLYGQMLPVRTGSPLCSSPLYIAAGVSAVCLSVRSSDCSDHTGTASPRCAPSCVGPGGNAE